jgi:hypothetical protein
MKQARIIAIALLVLVLPQANHCSVTPSYDPATNSDPVYGVLNPPKPPDLATAAAHGNRLAKVVLVAVMAGTFVAYVAALIYTKGGVKWSF